MISDMKYYLDDHCENQFCLGCDAVLLSAKHWRQGLLVARDFDVKKERKESKGRDIKSGLLKDPHRTISYALH